MLARAVEGGEIFAQPVDGAGGATAPTAPANGALINATDWNMSGRIERAPCGDGRTEIVADDRRAER